MLRFQKNHYLKKIQAIICLDMMAGAMLKSFSESEISKFTCIYSQQKES